MEILYWEKAFHAGKKIKKMNLPTQKIFLLRPWGQVFQFHQIEFDWECRVLGNDSFPPNDQ